MKICTVSNCDKQHKCLGYCGTHYARLRYSGYVSDKPIRAIDPTRRCDVSTCDLPYEAKGYCTPHYKRLKKNGDLGIDKPVEDRSYLKLSFEDALWSRVNKNGPLSEYDPSLGPCWLWGGSYFSSGYGRLQYNKKIYSVHRLVYEKVKGPIPKKLVLDHLCRVTMCCNPSHLEPVTHRENLLRGFGPQAINAKKTECVNGHLFNERNTYYNPNTGQRTCIACNRAWTRAKRLRLSNA